MVREWALSVNDDSVTPDEAKVILENSSDIFKELESRERLFYSHNKDVIS